MVVHFTDIMYTPQSVSDTKYGQTPNQTVSNKVPRLEGTPSHAYAKQLESLCSFNIWQAPRGAR